MNRHDMFRRSWLLAAMILFLATAILPTTAAAQTPCPCVDGTVYMDAGVGCDMEICYKYVSGLVCRHYTPGTTTNFPCQDPMTIYLKDCHGNLIEIGVGQCVYAVPVGPFCCVDACLERDANGCLFLKVKPSPILNCRC